MFFHRRLFAGISLVAAPATMIGTLPDIEQSAGL
jgi:hypothetical protein